MLVAVVLIGCLSQGLKLEVTLRPEISPVAIRKSLGSSAARVTKLPYKGVFTVEFRDKASLNSGEAKLRAIAKKLRADDFRNGERAIDWNSLRDVKRFHNDTKVQHARRPSEMTEERLEALGMRLMRLETRAFPNDTYDPLAYRKADSHRKKMADRGDLTDGPISGWSYMGPRNLNNIGGSATTYKVAGRVSAVAFSPSDANNTYYIGGANGGVWRTTNGGTSWTALTDDWPFLQVSDIKIDPTNANRIFVATGDAHSEESYGMGIMRSLDGGQSWTEVGQELNGAFQEIITIDPDNTNFIHVAAEDGLYRSTNGGDTFSKVSTIDTRVLDVEFGDHTSTNNRYYYAAGLNGKIWRSTSRGSTWTLVLNNASYGNIRALACSKVYDDTIYAICDSKQVLRSTDSGQTWSTTLTTGFPHHREPANLDYKQWSQVGFDYQAVASYRSTLAGPQDVLYVGLFDLSMYVSGTWYELGGTLTLQPDPQIHCDHHDQEIHPTNPNISLVGSDGGVYLMTRNTDNTISVDNLNANLYVGELWHMMAHPTSSITMLGGLQHQGSAWTDGPLTSWAMANRGDGAYCAISRQNPLKQFTSIQNYQHDGTYASIRRTLDGWATADSVSVNIGSTDPAFIPPIAIDPNNGNIIYLGNRYLHRWTDTGASGGTSTTALGNQQFGATVTAIAVSPANSNVIYVGTSNGEVWRTGNYGTSFTKISNASLPTARVTSIAPSLSSTTNVAVTLGGVDVGHGHVFRCLNTSAVTPIWEDRSGTGANALPDLPMKTLCRDPNTNEWYAGGEAGAFYSPDFGANWYKMGQFYNLPNAEVTMMHAPGNGYLFASTYGRGIWRIPISNSETSLLSIAASAGSITGGNNVGFTVELTQVAPPGGLAVTMSSNNSNLDISNILFFSQNQDVRQITASTSLVSATQVATVTASLDGVTRTANVTLNPVFVSTITGSLLVRNTYDASYTVTLDRAAPLPGVSVQLGSSNTAALQVPANLTIGSGLTTRDFTATTSYVPSDTVVTVSATRLGVTRTTTTTVTSYGVNAISAPASVYSGLSFNGTVRIDRAAPLGGIVVNLSATGGVSVPSTVTVLSGSTGASYTGTAPVVASTTNVSVTGSIGSSTATRIFSVQPAVLDSVSVSPNPMFGNGEATVTLTFLGRVPALRQALIRAIRPNGLTLTVPRIVNLNSSNTTTTFIIESGPTTTPRKVRLEASYDGVTKSTTFGVNP